MKFHPIKYRQPLMGIDSRCALYVLANFFDDRAFLLYRNVGHSTSHNDENGFLTHRRALITEKSPVDIVTEIYPYYIVPNGKRIFYDEVLQEVQPDVGQYVLMMVDVLGGNKVDAHTIGVIWGEGDWCACLDSQKDFIEQTTKENLFSSLHVLGIRILQGESEEIATGVFGPACAAQFSHDELPHIFAESISTCAPCPPCPPIPADVAERETKEIREFCKSNGAYIIPTRKELEDHFESVPQRIEYRNIRHEVTYKETE